MAKPKGNNRSNQGSSLIELMVSAIIIGFVIAAISQAIFVNTAWFSVLQNRVENGMAARLFLKKLAADIRTSYQVDYKNSDLDTLILFRISPTQFDSNGFFNQRMTTQSSQVIYDTEQDPTTPGTFRIKFRDTLSGENRYILYGILGPLSKANASKPAIFQYLNREYPCSQTDSPNAQTGTIVVNLELRRTEFGSDTGAFQRVNSAINEKSAIALRSEIMLRNSVLHGSN